MHLNNLKEGWRKIRIIDQYLIIIMIILVIYSISTVFIVKSDLGVAGNVDIVMRTTIASIFGYFISSNFIKNEPLFSLNTDADEPQDSQPAQPENRSASKMTISSKIGFTADHALEDPTGNGQQTVGAIGTNQKPIQDGFVLQNNRLQIRIIGTLCICSIFVLICIRYFVNSDSIELATVSQFRDILCGSIGFLIGMPSGSTKG